MFSPQRQSQNTFNQKYKLGEHTIAYSERIVREIYRYFYIELLCYHERISDVETVEKENSI